MHDERGSGDSRRGIDRRAHGAGRKSSSSEENPRKQGFQSKGARTMSTATTTDTIEKSTSTPVTKVVPRAEWLAARKELLIKEKEFTRLRDELSRQRREMPWVKVEKGYQFKGPDGPTTLADLFDGRSQLVVYHFMFGPGWKEGCPSCSYLADSFDTAALHMAQRDTSFAVISRATLPEIEAFKKRMGWRFPWVSSFGTDFNYDFHVSFSNDKKDKSDVSKVYYNFTMMEFPSEEAPGMSVFYKKGDEVFHSYSTYARGLDILVPTYNLLDLTPKGRDEDSLPWPMAWVRHHDRYSDGKPVDLAKLTKTSA
jgi:predicted dithiol-disulfide oxidoreductase (DUF899 family)